MDFKTYYQELDGSAREKLAAAAGTSVPYLSQLAYGHRAPSRKMAEKIEAATDGVVRAVEMIFGSQAAA